MGLACGKHTFEVEENMKYTSQSSGFYRAFEHLSYWNAVKNGGTRPAEPDNATENRSVASTVAVNGANKSESSSIDDETVKSVDD